MGKTRTFVFVVYVIFGVLTLLSVFAGIALLFLSWPAGIVALILAVVFAVMTGSLRRSLRDLSR